MTLRSVSVFLFSLSSLFGVATAQLTAPPLWTPPADGSLNDLVLFLGEKPVMTEVQDSVPARRQPRLLPEKMGLFEHALWGESGLFRITGVAPLTVEGRKNELSLRRTMLTAHQIGGFVTLATFIPTLIYGQRNIQNWNDAEAGRAPLDRSLHSTHETWARITFFSYIGTASLSLFSPPPLLRRDEGTIGIHKTLAWVHVIGMLATPILAELAAHEGRTGSPQRAHDLRTAHQIVAYTTAAALTASMVIVTF